MPAFVADVSTPIQALADWLSRPETRQRMQAAVSEAVAAVEQHILSDTSLRVPRRREDREQGFRRWLDAYADGFDLWIESYKHQLAQRIQSEVLSAFPETFAGVRNKDMVRETVEASVWPQVEPQLRQRAEDLLVSYAVRGIALAWTCRNISDNLLLGLPEEYEDGWCIPLHQPSTERRLVAVCLDKNGEVVSDSDALRIEVEAAL